MISKEGTSMLSIHGIYYLLYGAFINECNLLQFHFVKANLCLYALPTADALRSLSKAANHSRGNSLKAIRQILIQDTSTWS